MAIGFRRAGTSGETPVRGRGAEASPVAGSGPFAGVRDGWQALLDQAAGSAPIQRFWNFYQSRSPQDQRALVVMGLALLALLIGYGFLWPLQQQANAARLTYAQVQDDLMWMQANRHRVSPAAARPAGQTLLSLVTQSAAAHGLAIRRFEPVGEDGISLNLDEVEFDRAIGWLAELMQNGVLVQEFSATGRQQSGIADLRIVLRD